MPEPQITDISRLRRIALIARWGTGLLLFVMFLGTHLPIHVAHGVGGGDHIAHLVAYMVLTVCILTSWELSSGILQPQHYFTVWLFGTLYGAFDEITQIPVGRHCDGMDWLADIVGIVAGLTIFRIVRPLLYRLINNAA
jgi:VanZ family protein